MSVELEDITSSNLFENNDNKNVTLKSNSTCSSRSSHTCDEDMEEKFEDNNEILEENSKNSSNSENNDSKENESDEEESIEEERINAIIPKFPVQVIGMEYCENTLDDLILSEDLSTDEWYSALMQIIMILITYQKAFYFTHNDLHTNNVMYNETDKKFIYYCYKKKHYKVPT